jgi:chromosomal replication initiation ATPase DnaA
MKTIQSVLENSLAKNLEHIDSNEIKFTSKWNEFCEVIKKKCSLTEYRNWISPIKIIRENSKEIELSIPNASVEQHIKNNYRDEMEKIFPKDVNGKLAVIFTIEIPNRIAKDFDYVECRHLMNEEIFVTQIGKKYRNAVLENCNSQIIHPDLIKWGFEWAKNPTSIFIHGGVGCGKTFYAFSLIRQALRERKISKVEHFVGTTLDSEGLEAIKSEHGDRQFLKNIKKSEFLFIDDFGRETKSERLSRQYFDIIDYRYANEMPTIITSNLDLKGVANKTEEAIASRLQEWEIIKMTGKDARGLI